MTPEPVLLRRLAMGAAAIFLIAASLVWYVMQRGAS